MNKQVIMRRYLRAKHFGYSGQPGVDHFNLNAVLENIASTAQNVSGQVSAISQTVQKDISAIDALKQTIGTNISGLRTAVKTAIQPVGSTAQGAINGPQTTYLDNVSAVFAKPSPMVIAGIMAAALFIIFMVRK